jgi:hypothetical protein
MKRIVTSHGHCLRLAAGRDLEHQLRLSTHLGQPRRRPRQPTAIRSFTPSPHQPPSEPCSSSITAAPSFISATITSFSTPTSPAPSPATCRWTARSAPVRCWRTPSAPLCGQLVSLAVGLHAYSEPGAVLPGKHVSNESLAEDLRHYRCVTQICLGAWTVPSRTAPEANKTTRKRNSLLL